MGQFNMHKMKRMAHQEAWYGNSANPFRRTRTNTSVYGTTIQEPDVENGEGNYEQPARRSTEPPPKTNGDPSPYTGDDASPTAGGTSALDYAEKPQNTRMTGAGHTEQSSEETKVEGAPAESVDNTEGVRQRKGGLLGIFHKDKSDSGRAATGLSAKSGKASLKHAPFTVGNQIKGTIFNSWINILLIAAPVGIALNYVSGIPPIAVFLVNFIAIIPLAALLSYATEEIALRVGEVLGGLLNATFGNAVELIVSILALRNGQVTIVKTSLIGSMLSNLLLVMGMCFFFGGIRRSEQFFNVTVATTAASLLAMAIASVIIPTAFDQFSDTTAVPIAALSRGVAVILLAVYACYLFFQLKTHSAMYQQESQKVAMKPRKHHVEKGKALQSMAIAGALGAKPGRAHTATDDINPSAYQEQAASDGEEAEEPNLHIWVAVGLLAVSTVIIAFCAEFMVDSITAFSTQYNISQEFIGLILLPIVGNAAEHATAVTVACKDKMDLAIGVAVGSSMQIALLVIPFTVILGWILGNDDMNLSFDGFQVSVLFVSILLVNYLIGDGKSHWLEGVLLQALYIIIAVTAWYYPIATCTNEDPNSAACTAS